MFFNNKSIVINNSNLINPDFWVCPLRIFKASSVVLYFWYAPRPAAVPQRFKNSQGSGSRLYSSPCYAHACFAPTPAGLRGAGSIPHTPRRNNSPKSNRPLPAQALASFYNGKSAFISSPQSALLQAHHHPQRVENMFPCVKMKH